MSAIIELLQRLGYEQGHAALLGVDGLEELSFALPQAGVVDSGSLGRFQGAFRTPIGMDDRSREIDDWNSAQPADERSMRVEPALPFPAEHGALHAAERVGDVVDLAIR